MCHRSFIIAACAAAFTSAARTDTIDPCSLLSESDMIELGMQKDSAPSHELQPGGVHACKYQFRSAGTTSGSMVSIILSQAVPERVLQLRALQAKVQEENSQTQLLARGEYFQDKVMCKVVSVSQQETSQCIGSSEQSVVALVVSRPSLSNAVTYPALQLQIIAALVSRVASRGG